MTTNSLPKAIMAVADTVDFRPLFEHLADDVELRVTVAVRSAVCERHGKRSVMRHLRPSAPAEIPRVSEPPDSFADGRRIVAFREQTLSLGGSVAIHGECAFVFDVHDGLVTRLGIHHELAPLMNVPSDTPLELDADEIRRMQAARLQLKDESGKRARAKRRARAATPS